MKNRKSFTLIELLIAVSIFAVIMTVAYSAFSTGLFGYRNIDKSLYLTQTARSILNRISLDLRNAFAFSEDDAMFTGETGEEVKIEFFTLVDKYLEEEIIPVYARVAYYLDVDDNALLRLARLGKEGPKEDSEVPAQRMCDDVAITFEYGLLKEGEIEFISEWGKDTQAKDGAGGMPAAVRITLTKDNAVFRRTVYLLNNEK